MLNEKLEQANRDATKARIRLAIICSSFVLFAGLIVLSFVHFQKNSAREQQPTNVTTVTSVAPVASVPSASIQKQNHTPQDMPAPTSPAPELPIAEPIPNVSTEVGREEFKAAFKVFERDLAPQIADREFEVWNSNSQRKILAMKDEAAVLFSGGEYSQALVLLRRATERANAEITAREATYKRLMQDASVALNADDYDTAMIQITEALRFRPTSPDAHSLKREIDNLPAILKLLEAARIAHVENNSNSELEHLNQLLALDPSRIGVKERMDALAHSIKEQSFARYVANGIADVNGSALDSARRNLSSARKLYPNRQEVDVLATKIDALARDLETERMLAEALKAGQADNWQAALSFFGQARGIQPENKVAVDGYTLAQAITSAHEELLGYLKAPDRLSSVNVSALAKKAADRARTVASSSPSVVSTIKNLELALTLYNTKVAVRVISDGETMIAVRGVGRVGVVMSKIIELKPGNYSFEGKRLGYKSVLLQVKIPPGIDEFEVSVICNEQI